VVAGIDRHVSLHGLKYPTSLRIHHNQKERDFTAFATIGIGA
jgi:hypothetical protein